MIFAHFRNSWNFGDNNCCPADYFDYPGAIKCATDQIPPGDDPVILGGGGLLFCGQDSWIASLAKKRPVILWGVGLNYPACQVPENWADSLRDCKLVGLRDYGYVKQAVEEGSRNIVCAPCPSCYHPDFPAQRASAPSLEAVVYSHVSKPILSRFPSMENAASDGHTLPEVIRFLASGSTVITNSFHGAYWGLLLGRRVIIYNPLDSNRYYSALPDLPITTDVACLNAMLTHLPADRWIHKSSSGTGFLESARADTLDFKRRVDEWLWANQK